MILTLLSSIRSIHFVALCGGIGFSAMATEGFFCNSMLWGKEVSIELVSGALPIKEGASLYPGKILDASILSFYLKDPIKLSHLQIKEKAARELSSFRQEELDFLLRKMYQTMKLSSRDFWVNARGDLDSSHLKPESHRYNKEYQWVFASGADYVFRRQVRDSHQDVVEYSYQISQQALKDLSLGKKAKAELQIVVRFSRFRSSYQLSTKTTLDVELKNSLL